MVLRLTGDEDEFEFIEEEDGEEDIELVKLKARDSNYSPKHYSPMDNVGGR